jgi:meiotically up-regulated gene 157 (Mug157) protein
MDDANIPGLLSLPYLEYIDRSDPVYLATRRAVLSRATNPYFFSGFAGEGVGGPH